LREGYRKFVLMKEIMYLCVMKQDDGIWNLLSDVKELNSRMKPSHKE